MLAPTELVIRDYYGRDDHKEFIECIMSLKEPEKKLETQNELFRIGVKEIFEDVNNYKLFNIVRSDKSTVESTLIILEIILEKHFNI